MQSDKLIVDLFWHRDDNGLKLLADRYGTDLSRISYRILYDEEDVKECVNDAYLNTWNSIPEARPASLFAYVGKIVRNLSINRLKMKMTQKRGGQDVTLVLTELEECVASGTDVESELECKELAEEISHFLYSIKKEHKMIFVERYWYVKTVKEIATDYEMSSRKVEAILYRCRKKLREYLSERGYSV